MGAKADIIALSPEAKLVREARYSFMVTPEDRYLPNHNDDEVAQFTNAFTFTNSYEETEVTMRIQMKASIYMKMFLVLAVNRGSFQRRKTQFSG